QDLALRFQELAQAVELPRQEIAGVDVDGVVESPVGPGGEALVPKRQGVGRTVAADQQGVNAPSGQRMDLPQGGHDVALVVGLDVNQMKSAARFQRVQDGKTVADAEGAVVIPARHDRQRDGALDGLAAEGVVVVQQDHRGAYGVQAGGQVG